MSSLTIQSINLINDQITVLFNQFWFQEDITTLRQLLLSKTKNLCIKETIIGADLENVRFEWKNTEFIINFDYYSQSCWIDTQDPDRLMEVHALFNLLTQDNKHYVV